MRHRRLIGTLLLVLALALAAHVSGLRDNFSLAAVRDTFLAHKTAGLLLFITLFAVGNLLHVPGLLFQVAAVLALGKWWGGLATYVAANISCVVTYAVFRGVGGNALMQIKNPLAGKLMRRLHEQPIRSLVLLRIIFQSMPTLNMALGMSGLKLRHLVIGTLLGLPLPIAFYCVFFDFLAASIRTP